MLVLSEVIHCLPFLMLGSVEIPPVSLSYPPDNYKCPEHLWFPDVLLLTSPDPLILPQLDSLLIYPCSRWHHVNSHLFQLHTWTIPWQVWEDKSLSEQSIEAMIKAAYNVCISMLVTVRDAARLASGTTVDDQTSSKKTRFNGFNL